jgi:hypothetical protein
MSRVLAFLRHLFAWEQLPRDEVAPPERRPGFFRTVAAGERLPRDEVPTEEARRPGFWRWLAGRERLPLDPPGGASGAPDSHTEGDR